MKHFLRVKRYLLHIYHNVVDLYAGHGTEGTERDAKQKVFSLPNWKDDFSEGLCENSSADKSAALFFIFDHPSIIPSLHYQISGILWAFEQVRIWGFLHDTDELFGRGSDRNTY